MPPSCEAKRGNVNPLTRIRQFEEAGDWYGENICYFLDIIQGGVGDAPLHLAHMSPVEASHFGKLFLGYALLQS